LHRVQIAGAEGRMRRALQPRRRMRLSQGAICLVEGGQGSEPAELFRDDARMAFAVFPVEALVDRIGRGVSWTAANSGQSVDYGLSSFPIAAQDAQDIEPTTVLDPSQIAFSGASR
jgi:hypothetical protein